MVENNAGSILGMYGSVIVNGAPPGAAAVGVGGLFAGATDEELAFDEDWGLPAQAALDQAGPEALPGGRDHRRSVVLAPLDLQLLRRPAPDHLDPAVAMGQRAVLGRVGGELVEQQAERQRLGRRQRH